MRRIPVPTPTRVVVDDHFAGDPDAIGGDGWRGHTILSAGAGETYTADTFLPLSRE